MTEIYDRNVAGSTIRVGKQGCRGSHLTPLGELELAPSLDCSHNVLLGVEDRSTSTFHEHGVCLVFIMQHVLCIALYHIVPSPVRVAVPAGQSIGLSLVGKIPDKLS